MSAPGRNDACPCGSGAKYKRCCGAATREGYTEDEREAARIELGRFCSREEFRQTAEVASMLFWGDWPHRLGPERLEELCASDRVVCNFEGFLHADVRVDGDETLIDELLRRCGSSLPVGQRRYLQELRSSHLGVYEVREAGSEGERLLHDLWTDEEDLRVRAEILPPDADVPGNVLVGRVVRHPSGGFALEEDFYTFPATFKDTILRRLEADRRSAEESGPALAPGAFLKRVGFRFHGLWLESREPEEPRRSRSKPRYPYLSAYLTDYLDGRDLSFRVPSRMRLLGLYLGRIVAGFTRGDAPEAAGDVVWTGVECRRRPGRIPCGGEVLAGPGEEHEGLEWSCSSCGDAGTISGWRGTAFDLSVRTPPDRETAEAPEPRELEITTEDHRRLLRLSHLTADALTLLVADRQEGGTALLRGSVREYAALADCIEQELAVGSPSPTAAERLAWLRSGLRWAAHERSDPTAEASAGELTPHAARGPRLSRRPTAAPPDGGHVLHVRLRYIEPPIWRRVEVPSRTSLADLHDVLITAMGWHDEHLHLFRRGERTFAPAGSLDDDRCEDTRNVWVGELLPHVDDHLLWEYDFGDSWLHEVRVESIEPERPPRPRLLAGQRACPPEDCGGPPGYEHLLEALADPAHPEHHVLREWSGPFDPEAFSAKRADRLLALRTKAHA